MFEKMNIENENVLQPEVLTGQVNNHALTVLDIVNEAVNRPTSEELAREERLALLESARIRTSTEVEQEVYSLSVDGVGIFALSDIHALKGKQKSGKSAVLKICTAALMSGRQFRVKSELEEPVVLFLDSEQQAADVKLIIDEVKHMTQCEDDYIDTHLLLYSLRRMSYDTLLNDTRLLIEKHHPKVVFIDGLVDYVATFNDEVMSRQLIRDVLFLCEEHKCAIVNVLHENKATDDENMRGHLGTVLSQKAGTVLQCQKSKSGIINVTCPDARHGTMPRWTIRFDQDGHLIDADAEHRQEVQAAKEIKAAARQAAKELALQNRFDLAMRFVRENGGSILHVDLVKKMAEIMGRDRTTVGRYLKELIKEGKLFETNKVITASSQTMLAL